MRHGGGLLPRLLRAPNARCRKPDLTRHDPPANHAASRKHKVFIQSGRARFARRYAVTIKRAPPLRQAGRGIGLPEGKPQQKKVRPLTRHRICPDHAEANNRARPFRQAGARSGLSGLSSNRQRRSSLLSGRTRHRICQAIPEQTTAHLLFSSPPGRTGFCRTCAEAGTARRKQSMSASPCPPTCIRAKGRSGVSDPSPARRRPAPRSPAGAIFGNRLGPSFVPKCRTPRADPAAEKLSLA